MNLIINDKDFSGFLTKYGYTVSQRKILGANGFVTLDGTTHEDIIAWKSDLTVTIRPLKSDKLKELVETCSTGSLVVTFFDTRLNADRTTEMIPELSQASVSLIKTDTNFWGAGDITLKLKEK